MLCLTSLFAACGGGAEAADGGSDGSGPVPDGGVIVGPDGGTVGSCLGASLLTSLGQAKVMVGGAMADATAKSTPISIRYDYLSGGLFDGTTPCASCAVGCTAKGHTCANSAGQGGCAWWGCYQYDMDPPGAFVRTIISTAKAATPPYVPMFSYYELLQTSGAAEGAAELAALSNASLMTRYFNDWRFLLQQVGNDVALLHIEPDLWGFAEQANADPHALPAAVSTVNAADCAAVEETVAGVGQCMIAMARKYAPNAKVGLHASAWAGGPDALTNTAASLDLTANAAKIAAFLVACGEGGADFITVEASDRDAGYYQSIGKNVSWDATNQMLPDYTQAMAWYSALTSALGKPAILWQLPLGNASQSNTTDHWKDNRVDYLFAHTADLAAAHLIGFAFGAGAGGQTTPESDGGNFIAHVKAYVQAGGQALCP